MKEPNIKAHFNNFDKEAILTYTTQSESKTVFAERNLRSLKNFIYKYLEHKWTHLYIHTLQSFVGIINSRDNGGIELAPKKVTRKHVSLLRALAAESKEFVKPRFTAGNGISIAKEDSPFIKGYK